MGESAIGELGQLVQQLIPSCPEEIVTRLARLYASQPQAALTQLSLLASAHLDEAAPPLIEAALASADPKLALEGLAALAEREASLDDAPKMLRWLRDPSEAQALIALLAGSPFLTDILVRYSEWLPWVLDEGRHSWSRSELRADVEHEVSGTPPAGLPLDWARLRRWHERHLLRVGWADLAGWLDVMDAAADLSALADVAIDTVAQAHIAALEERYGEPCQEDGAPARWCILSLGKLGGNELNFRSDIDLMFLYSAEGKSSGGKSPGVGLNEWFSRWAERTLETLTEVSPDGMLYRVDTRLRPDGRSGTLVRSLASYEHYYETRGEVWERQMLIKARPVAGNLSLGELLLHTLEPFIFPRTLSESPRQEIRKIKSRILDHLAAQDLESGSSRAEDNLKLRRGGLRDIEFVVQCLQLVAGGADRKVRSGTSLEAIEQMRRRRVLNDEEAIGLTTAYRLYRRIEHRLQMAAGQQTFTLPRGEEPERVLARRLGYPDERSFRSDLEQARNTVIRTYDDVLGPPESPDDVALILELPAGADQVQPLLVSHGFRDPESAHRNLRHLAYGHDDTALPDGSRQSVRRLLPKLLDQLGQSPDPDRGLRNIEQVLHALGAVDSFSDLLASHPGFLELLVTLCSGSQSLTDTVLRDPALIDWMLYSGVLLAERSVIEVDLVLRASIAGLADLDEILSALYSFRKQEVLRIGLRHLLHLANDDQTCEQLTAIADATVRQVYRLSVALGHEHRGCPAERAGLAVIALGKLGSSLMNFGSDLDLVFVHTDDGETETGTPAIDFFSFVAQTILRILSENTPQGILYEVDVRLRPEGRNGPITLPLSGYRHYLQTRASTWERQALTCYRIIAGPTELTKEIASAIERFVSVSPGHGADRGALLDEVAQMRARMEAESRRRYPDHVNIKTGPGGLVDAEFVAQLGQLLHGSVDPAVRGGNTLSMLAHLKAAAYLPGSLCDALAEGYRELRGIQIVLRIKDEHAHNVLPTDSQAAQVLARIRGFESADELRERVDGTMKRIRMAYGEALAWYRRSAT